MCYIVHFFQAMWSTTGILRIRYLRIESQRVENPNSESLKYEILKVESINAWTLKDHVNVIV